MTDTLLVLGQLNPSANILTTLYTVPSATSTTISSLVICNQSNSGGYFNVSIAIGGASDTTAQYLYYNTPLDANDTFVATIGISLATTDQVRILASSNNMSFNLFGVQIS